MGNIMNNKNYCTPAGREIIVNRIKKLKEKKTINYYEYKVTQKWGI